MSYKKLTLLVLVTILLFSCASGGQPIGDKTIEQLDYEAELFAGFLGSFFDHYSPFEDEELGPRMMKKSTSSTYTTRGPQGGKAVIKLKTRSVPDLPNWNFNMDFSTLFKNYNYKGLIVNSKDAKILIDMDMILTGDDSDEINGTFKLLFSGTFHYSGEATGTARFKLVAEADMSENFDDVEPSELYFSIDGIEMDTEEFDLFDSGDGDQA